MMPNNYEDQSESEPVECSKCFTSMIESCDGKFLICENAQCNNEIELKEKDDE